MNEFFLRLQRQIEPHLERIERILAGNYKLTLVARYVGKEPLDDADILLTVDDLSKAKAALERLAARDPTVTPAAILDRAALPADGRGLS